jgi:hypothetical protein
MKDENVPRRQLYFIFLKTLKLIGTGFNVTFKRSTKIWFDWTTFRIFAFKSGDLSWLWLLPSSSTFDFFYKNLLNLHLFTPKKKNEKFFLLDDNKIQQTLTQKYLLKPNKWWKAKVKMKIYFAYNLLHAILKIQQIRDELLMFTIHFIKYILLRHTKYFCLVIFQISSTSKLNLLLTRKNH